MKKFKSLSIMKSILLGKNRKKLLNFSSIKQCDLTHIENCPDEKEKLSKEEFSKIFMELDSSSEIDKNLKNELKN